MTDKLITPKADVGHWESTSDLEAFQQRAREATDAAILDQLPAKERLEKERAKIAKLEAEVAAKEMAELAKVQQLEGLNQRYQAISRELDNGGYMRSLAENFTDGATLEACLSAKHPNPRFNGSIWGLLEIAGYELAAKHVIARFPSWKEGMEKELASVTSQMEELARELKLESKMPFPMP